MLWFVSSVPWSMLCLCPLWRTVMCLSHSIQLSLYSKLSHPIVKTLHKNVTLSFETPSILRVPQECMWLSQNTLLNQRLQRWVHHQSWHLCHYNRTSPYESEDVKYIRIEIERKDRFGNETLRPHVEEHWLFTARSQTLIGESEDAIINVIFHAWQWRAFSECLILNCKTIDL